MNAKIKRSIDGYFRGYRSLLARNPRSGIEAHGDVSNFFGRLRHDIPALRRIRLENERRNAPRFNIFRVLPVERRETVLHSPLLAHLLDPTASHGQGCLFLRTFLDVARENANLVSPPEPLDPDSWSVRSEVYIGNGTIDLLLECFKTGYVIVVENKIEALEQPAQLSRYHRWMQERRSHFASRQLVFLTPKGHASELSPRIPCVLMSYKRDILELLFRTIPKLQPPHLKELLVQYQDVLSGWLETDEDEQT